MSRTVDPYLLANNGSSASAQVGNAPEHPYEIVRNGRQQGSAAVSAGVPSLAPTVGTPLVPLVAAPSLPIRVTTASHPDPGLLFPSSQQLNLQLTTGGLPQKQLHLSTVKRHTTYAAPLTLAGPKGGFTLPLDFVESPVAGKPATAVIKHSASAIQLFQGYSAASVASIHAQDERKFNALGRHSYSAPNTVVLSQSKNKSKHKYRKVVGGKTPKSTLQVSFQVPAVSYLFYECSLSHILPLPPSSVIGQ